MPYPGRQPENLRYRTPEGIARQMKSVYDEYRIKFYFGTDDNFFNRRETAAAILETLARTATAQNKRLGDRIRWGTEATQADTYKNRDLLPVAQKAGLNAIWFGIEDLTAELINKGQKPEVTERLFKLLDENNIAPMAMMMYHDGQPFKTRNSLYGISNQMQFLRNAGAVSLQCTVHVPMIGTKEQEKTFNAGKVVAKVGGKAIEERHFDGNHIIVSGSEPDWSRQVKFLGAYASFYNPFNLLRAFRDDGSRLRKYRMAYQFIGMIATGITVLKTLPYLLRLRFTKTERHQHSPPQYPVPVTYAPGAFPRWPSSQAGVAGDDASASESTCEAA